MGRILRQKPSTPLPEAQPKRARLRLDFDRQLKAAFRHDAFSRRFGDRRTNPLDKNFGDDARRTRGRKAAAIPVGE
jgi:hypothetical protein